VSNVVASFLTSSTWWFCPLPVCMLHACARRARVFHWSAQRSAHWQLVASLLTDVFGTPRGHPKSKPFIDR
jgi:hypothetical protein